MALLEIRNLTITVGDVQDSTAAVSSVDLDLDRGEVLGVVGESGAGKTMLSRAIAGILPDSATGTGSVSFDGTNVLTMDSRQLHDHRGAGVAYCFQQPRRALNPMRRVGAQLVDRLVAHHPDATDPEADALRLFHDVGIQSPSRRLRAFPHELSGGMAQRAMIALALSCSPDLLVADEPTTGLDATLTRSILQLIRKLATEHDRALLIVSHDLAAIAEVCDRVAVMYAGTIVEEGPVRDVLRNPRHPYTRSLLAAVPDISGAPITVTPGVMPTLTEPPTACPFAARCPIVQPRCREERPVLVEISTQRSACFFADRPAAPSPVLLGSDASVAKATAPADDAIGVRVTGLDVTYRGRFGRRTEFKALKGINLTVRAGETLGIVGESGSGKTTLGRAIVGLVKPSDGVVAVAGTNVSSLTGDALRRHRRHMQMVFQDPIDTLNPRWTVFDTLRSSAKLVAIPASEVQQRIHQALVDVGLDPVIISGRRRHELSGGQAQRVGIARALIVDPQVIVLDEPTSALDVTVQAQVLEVMRQVIDHGDRSYVFISHDLAVIRNTCDSIAVLYMGSVVEQGPVDRVFSNPLHPYTQALLASVATLQEDAASPDVELKTDLDDMYSPQGCPLALRCPFATTECESVPQVLTVLEPDHAAACWRAAELAKWQAS